MTDRRIVIATTNRGKLAEYRLLIGDREFVTVSDLIPGGVTVVEDGETFEANALKKAREVSRATGMIALADDSGLEVDLLGGLPGVRSARFAHEDATDEENNNELVQRLRRSGGEAKQFPARFRAVLALVDPSDLEGGTTASGTCEGFVIATPRGTGGFGYDPLFIPEGYDKTLAELDLNEKNKISHRAKAVWALKKLIA